MLQVTPSRTAHGRKDATFRTGTKHTGGLPDAIVKSNRRKKRKLINQARELASATDLLAAGRGLVAVKHKWNRIGPAGDEYEAGLRKEFARVYEDFRARYASEAGAARNSARTSRAGDGRLHPDHLTAGLGRFTAAADEPVNATEPSQALPRVGGGRAGETTTPDTTSPPTTPASTPPQIAGTPQSAPAETLDGTEPSQPARTVDDMYDARLCDGTAPASSVPSQVKTRVGGGAAGETTPPAAEPPNALDLCIYNDPSKERGAPVALSVPSQVMSRVGGGTAGETTPQAPEPTAAHLGRVSDTGIDPAQSHGVGTREATTPAIPSLFHLSNTNNQTRARGRATGPARLT